MTIAPVPRTTLDSIHRALGDRYAIERELGRGGMGTVYLARDLRLDRLVALKVLPAEFASQVALRERFLRETRTAASFSHPNIVPVYAVEESDALLAYAMGLVEGETLAERVARMGPLPTREIVRVLQDVGYALAYAHGRGVVHSRQREAIRPYRSRSRLRYFCRSEHCHHGASHLDQPRGPALRASLPGHQHPGSRRQHGGLRRHA